MACSLDEFLAQLKTNLNIPPSENLKVEVYDPDAEEYFLLVRLKAWYLLLFSVPIS